MGTAQNLKVTHSVDKGVREVVDTVVAIDDRVARVDDRVVAVNDRVSSVDNTVKGVDDRVKEIASDVDEIRRLSFNPTSADNVVLLILQGTNYGKALTNGSPHQTPQRTTISHVVLITRKLPRGSFKAGSIRSGRPLARFSGSMENVCLLQFPG